MAVGFAPSGGGQIKDALDPFALPVSLALATGITTVYTTGGVGGFAFGGEPPSSALGSNNAVLKMAEGDVSAMLVKEPAMSTFSAAGGASMSAKWNLREQLRKAKEYQQKFEQYEKDKKAGKQVTEPKKPADVDPVLPLIRQERGLRVTASTVSDVRWALKLVDDFDIRIVIAPATEAWLIADEIAQRNVPLIITARSRVLADDRKNAPSGANPDAPGVLRKAGVKFAVIPPSANFSTGGTFGRDLLNYPLEAAFAVRGGCDEQSALEALTILPAQILGIADRVGSLEEGKDADVLILDGDPLDYRTFVEKTFVNGKLLYDKDKSPFFAHVKRQAVMESLSGR
jgi:imidazolonepropionase-like amidohydrolase